ncbi:MULTISPECIES: MFS transporter [unclassified Caballeronia]|uniref:MFS transporter n=1 Tax=unclassified Caballeronia TaxID=2646786 RepID=UPI0028579DBE|nr:MULTISPECIES: MFS transporter [unclassified Caballeronia]MDR5752382.1 MFS transporter [Caballeronia sp. LZ024]MDR5845187.1 MFS transporter [Caballeronia sp. LZ031]
MAASIGNFGEVYDFAIFGFSVPILAGHFFPGTDRTAALLSTFAVYAVAFFARPLGGVVFGFFADRIGRIKVLSATVWLMAAATALIGLLPTYESLGVAAPVLLVMCRIAQGLAMGGETTGSVSYIIESAPNDRRGQWVGYTWFFSYMPNAFVAVFLLGLQLAAGMAEYAEWVWRVPFLLGGFVGFIGFWLRRNLDDPEEYKQAATKTHVDNPLFTATRTGWKCMLHVVLVMPILCVASYLLLGFMYTFLIREAKLSPSMALLSNAAAILVLSVAITVGGVISDRFGRRKIMSIGTAWLAVVSYPAVYLSASGTLMGAIIGQFLVAIGVGLYGGAAFTAMPELFPTSFRATGHAVSYQLSVAIFGGTTPFIATWLVGSFGSPLAPGVYTALIAAAGLIALRFVPETNGVRLRTSVGLPLRGTTETVVHDFS